MKEIKTSIRIKASPERVWKELVDFSSYPEWNPFIKHLSGEIFKGGKIKVKVMPPKGIAMTFKPVLLRFEAPYEMRWAGKLFISGLFDGEHYFIIEEFEKGVMFTHGEKFDGLLVKPFEAMLDKTRNGFVQMNEALKARCERS